MFIGTMWMLTRAGDRHAPNRTMISIAIVLLVLSTVVSSFIDAQVQNIS